MQIACATRFQHSNQVNSLAARPGMFDNAKIKVKEKPIRRFFAHYVIIQKILLYWANRGIIQSGGASDAGIHE